MFCPHQKYQRFHFSTNFCVLSCNVFFRIILTKLRFFPWKYLVWLENFSSANIAFIAFSQGLFVLPFLNQSSLHKQNISQTIYSNSSKSAAFSFSTLPVADSLIWRSEHCTSHSFQKNLQVLFTFHFSTRNSRTQSHAFKDCLNFFFYCCLECLLKVSEQNMQ